MCQGSLGIIIQICWQLIKDMLDILLDIVKLLGRQNLLLVQVDDKDSDGVLFL